MGRYRNIITIQDSGVKIGNALTRLYSSDMRGENYDINVKNLGERGMEATIEVETTSYRKFVKTFDYINDVLHGNGEDEHTQISGIRNEKARKRKNYAEEHGPDEGIQ
jgi:hypothetical protein